MTSTDGLIKFWRKFELLPDKGPFVHPDDLSAIDVESHRRPEGQSDFEYLNADGIKFEVRPTPILGDLEKSRIVVCMLNPGIGGDSLYEFKDINYRKVHEKSLRQDFEKESYPFMFLNPEFCWTGGFKWWHAKFKRLAKKLSKEKVVGSHTQALMHLSRNVAAVELFAYPSKSFDNTNSLNIPSTLSVKEWVHKTVRDGEKHVIVARSAEKWGFDRDKKCKLDGNLYVMGTNRTRGSWFVNDDSEKNSLRN